MRLGPLFISISGTELSRDEEQILLNDLVGGVVLFTRNYQNKDQLKMLVNSIKALKYPSLFVSVDQEGGRVQRFQDDFYPIPEMRSLGKMYDQSDHIAMQAAYYAAKILGIELMNVGIDFSFAPVLDIDYGVSEIIGSRSFHSDPKIVGHLASSFFDGFQDIGMQCIAKHFPGHGFVKEDSHQNTPVDQRSIRTISKDLQPYKNLINKGLRGIMTAHIKYPLVDKKLATFSKFWLIEYLQKELQFNGIIFSDDLMMKSTDFLSSMMQKVNHSLEAGCDFVLICNSMQAVSECLSKLNFSDEQFTNLEEKSSSLRPLLDNSYDAESNLGESKTKLDLFQNSL